jgi:hypothetical protein
METSHDSETVTSNGAREGDPAEEALARILAFAQTCDAFNLPVAIERSRSGDGGHVWFFFSDPVVASVARRMGCFLLTETMARRHQLKMDSYDRLFPNQDTMPKGGFGKHLARDRARNYDLAPRVGEHVEPSDLCQGDEWRCVDDPYFAHGREASTPATTSSSVSWKGDTPYPPRASMNSARESPAISAARPWLMRPSSYHFTAAATRSSRVNVVGSCRTLASAPS